MKKIILCIILTLGLYPSIDFQNGTYSEYPTNTLTIHFATPSYAQGWGWEYESQEDCIRDSQALFTSAYDDYRDHLWGCLSEAAWALVGSWVPVVRPIYGLPAIYYDMVHALPNSYDCIYGEAFVEYNADLDTAADVYDLCSVF